MKVQYEYVSWLDGDDYDSAIASVYPEIPEGRRAAADVAENPGRLADHMSKMYRKSYGQYTHREFTPFGDEAIYRVGEYVLTVNDSARTAVLFEESAVDIFRAYRTDPEFSVDVPEQFDGDVCLTVEIAAVGGCEPGEAVAHSGWLYAVSVDGRRVLSGDDISSGTPSTHSEMVASLCNFLSYDAEMLREYDVDEETPKGHTAAQKDFLETHGERLGLFAVQQHG